MLVSPINFVLFWIYPFLIFMMSVIYACYSYSIWLILHLSFPYFQLVSHLCLLLLFNLAYFAFILALFLGCQSSMLVTPIQFGLFCIYPCLIFSLSVIYAYYSIQFCLFFIFSLLNFSLLVIYSFYSYPILLIFLFFFSSF